MTDPTVRVEVEMDLPAPVPVVEAFVGDLATYPQWMGLVHTVSDVDEYGGWRVELRGKIGPLARSKMLRMVRVDDAHEIRFERQELDGRPHGRWELQARLSRVGTDEESSTHLTITLSYEGRLWSVVVERILSEEIDRAKSRLADLVVAANQSR